MRLRVEPFTPPRVPAVRMFNQRLAAGGVPFWFPDNPVPDWLPPAPDSTIYLEYYVLLEDDNVRGAYMLKHRQVSFKGDSRWVGTMDLPLSEGTVNGAYSTVAGQLFRDAQRREPFLCGLGMGGEETQVAKLVRALGWRLLPVPFYFKVVNGTRFLRQIRHLRTSPFRRMLLDLAALSGVGWVGTRVADALLTRPTPAATTASVEVVDRFGEWADEIWERCRACYSFVGVRDSGALNRVYPPDRPHLVRLKVTRAGQVLGYAVAENREMAGSKHFGDMRVGTIFDGLALPEHAGAVLWQSTRALELQGVDLVVSNQTHPAWRVGLRQAGFVRGPTNFLFATAKPLTALLESIDPTDRGLHVNRGDGSWPWGVTFGVIG